MTASQAVGTLDSTRGALFRIALAGLAVLAASAVLYGTWLGIGLSNDSVNYLRAARGLLEGQGLIVLQGLHYTGPVPMTHWPPLYPLLLAASGWLGLDMESFARVANALLLAANVLLVGRFALENGGSTAGALVVAFLFATNREVLYAHQMAWTEPLYLFTALSSLALLTRHLQAPRPALIWGAGACAALALMTRYVGIAVVGAGALGCLLQGRGPLATRVRAAIRFGALPAAALAIWALRNRLVVDDPSYEQWSPALPLLAPLWKPIATTLTGWIWPFSTGLSGWGLRSAALAGAVLLGGCVVIGLAAVGALRSSASSADPRCAASATAPRAASAAGLLALYALCHLAFLYGTVIALFDAFVPEPRHLLPAALALVLALACVAPQLSARAAPPRLFAFAAGIGLGALLLAHGAHALRTQRMRSETGFGFREVRYTGSGLIALARALPPGTPVFSNAQVVAGLVDTLDMRFLPALQKPARSDANPAYAEQMRDMERVLREQGGMILVFANLGTAFPRADQLERELPLRLLLAERQGHAFAIR